MSYYKKIEEVVVRVEDGSIEIVQEGLGSQEDHRVILASEQIDLVISLLKDAQAALVKN